MSEEKSKNIKEDADAWDRYQNALNKLQTAAAMAHVMVSDDYNSYSGDIKSCYANGLAVMLEELEDVFESVSLKTLSFKEGKNF